MKTTIQIAGIDPSLRNTGIAIGELDTKTWLLKITKLHLVKTEPGKTRPASEDLLHRCMEIHHAVHQHTAGCQQVCAELPTGGSTKQAAFNLGAGFVAALVGLPASVVPVTPYDVKRAALGHLPSKQRDKKAMVAWVMQGHPEAPWPTYERDGVVHPVTDIKHLEHLADAIAAIHAGIEKMKGHHE